MVMQFEKALKLNWTERIPLTSTGVNRLKEVPGVYRLGYYNPHDNKASPFHVGQADNLKMRMQMHISSNEANAGIKKHIITYPCYFKAAAVSNKSDRDGCEVALYNKFKPKCVERIPDVDPININFD